LFNMSNKVTDLVVLINERRLAQRIKALADEITADYKDKKPVIIGILKGAFVFLADLVRELKVDHCVEFMNVSSYDNDPHSSGDLKLLDNFSRDLNGEDVLIVEDIVDSGRTLDYIYRILESRFPRSVETVTLLSKLQRRKVNIDVKYIGFEIPDKFVFGYGLDDAEEFRGLPFIAYKESEEV